MVVFLRFYLGMGIIDFLHVEDDSGIGERVIVNDCNVLDKQMSVFIEPLEVYIFHELDGF